MSTVRTKDTLGAVLVPAAVLAGLVLAACSNAEPPDAHPTLAGINRAHMDVLLANHPTDLVRDALADAWVSDSELAAAVDDFQQCFTGKYPDGSVSFTADGGRDVGPVPSDPDEQTQFDADLDACDRSYGPLSGLYYESRRNPGGLSAGQPIHQCFDDNGVEAGRGLTDDEFDTLLRGDGDERFDPGTRIGRACLANPIDPRSMVDTVDEAWPTPSTS